MQFSFHRVEPVLGVEPFSWLGREQTLLLISTMRLLLQHAECVPFDRNIAYLILWFQRKADRQACFFRVDPQRLKIHPSLGQIGH